MKIGIQSDNEQEELVKKWLKENGLSIVLGLAIGGGSIFGWNYYKHYKTRQNVKAAGLYSSLQNLDAKQYLEKSPAFINENSSSVYAVNSSMVGAAKAVTIKDYAKARQNLNWIMQNADNEAYRLLARLNLARLDINDGKYDAAIGLLADIDGRSFNAQYLLVLADAYAKKGDNANARATYAKARLLVVNDSETINLINMKINQLTANAGL